MPPTSLVAAGEYVADQGLWTYRPGRWPEGLISGSADGGCFHVRHVVTFRPGALRPMLAAGIEAARDAGFDTLAIHIPADFPPARALLRVARMCGFTPYAIEDRATYHVSRAL